MNNHKVFFALLIFIFTIGISYNQPILSVLKTRIRRVEAPPMPLKSGSTYDLIVIGGEPEGVAAAVSAARNGAKILLIESRSNLGGLLTFGMLNFLDLAYDENGKNLNQGIFSEWHKMVGNDYAFDIDEAKNAFLQLVQNEPNITLALYTVVTSPIMDGSTIKGINLESKNSRFQVYGKTFIDATQDADFAVQAGVPYFIGSEDINLRDRMMSATPILHLKGINWAEVQETAKSKKFGEATVTSTIANGFPKLVTMYTPGEKDTRFRGMNLVHIAHFSADDDFYINALQIFGVNGLSTESKNNALEKGKQEMNNVLHYLKLNFPGFENAQIASYPTELYIRETRHIRSEYQLPMSDVWENKDQWDSIGYGGYPVDIQATSSSDYGYVMSKPIKYAIPFRSLVPLKVDNLLVIGRSSGYSSLAAGSARTVPTGMTTGEAAGVAASLAVKKNISFPELSIDKADIEKLRQILKGQGALIDHFTVSHPYEGKWFDSSISFLMNYGLLCAGYDNNLHPEKPMTKHEFYQLMLAGTMRLDLQSKYKTLETNLSSVVEQTKNDGKPLTRDEAIKFIATSITQQMGINNWSDALKFHLIDQELYNQIPRNSALTNGQAYYLAAHVLMNFNRSLTKGVA